MVYSLIKKMINRGNYDYDRLLNKMDVFLLADRIIDDEYKELKDMMDAD